MPQPNPSFWARNDNSALPCASCVVTFIADALTTRFINASVITALAQSYVPLNGGLSGDPWPRCLTMTMTLIGAGNRGGSWRVSGVNQFGESVQELMDFGTQAGAGGPGNIYQMATRYAYKYVTQIDKVSFNGVPTGADTISFGITRNTIIATSGAFLTLNGSRPRQFSGFGLPIPVSSLGSTNLGAASTGYESEIGGLVVGENPAGNTFSQILDRGAGFFVDPSYNIMVLSDAQPMAGLGVALGELQLHIQTNRGE